MTAALQYFGPGLWIADGPTVAGGGGFRFPTRMAVARLRGGGLWVWSPIELTADVRAAVDVLGDVRYLVAPNALHHLFMAEWQDAYPSARAYAPPLLAKQRPDLAFDGVLGDWAPAEWAEDLGEVVVENRITAEALFFHRPSRTVLVTDLVQHLRPGWFKGWRALVARLDRMTAPEPSVPRKFRLGFRDRDAARAEIARVLAWPAERVVMAHGAPVRSDGQAVLRRAFAWLV